MLNLKILFVTTPFFGAFEKGIFKKKIKYIFSKNIFVKRKKSVYHFLTLVNTKNAFWVFSTNFETFRCVKFRTVNRILGLALVFEKF